MEIEQSTEGLVEAVYDTLLDLESLEQSQRDYLLTVPEFRRNIAARAFLGVASKRNAIKAQCQQCVGYQDVSAAIKDCRGLNCPLYKYRPYQ